MATLHNQIIIKAPIETIWAALSHIDQLDKYDPTVKKVSLVTSAHSGMGAKRKVEMLDGKNWFEEKVTVCKPHEALTFELTDCTFPMKKLRHSYSFANAKDGVTVSQVMEYEVKFGIMGKVLDTLMIGKQSDRGIKKFMPGSKAIPKNHKFNYGI